MRKTPVEDYLEEISTTLTEETYGRLSDAIYETNCEFDEEVASYRAENAKLRKLVSKFHFIDSHGCTECGHERGDEFCEHVCWLRQVEREMRDLGIEVDG